MLPSTNSTTNDCCSTAAAATYATASGSGSDVDVNHRGHGVGSSRNGCHENFGVGGGPRSFALVVLVVVKVVVDKWVWAV